MNEILKNRGIFLLLFLTGQVHCVFQQKSLASSFLSRVRRANVGLEELVDNNLQRECFEETCTKEEAAEYLNDEQQTEQFWKAYKVNERREHVAPGKVTSTAVLEANTSTEADRLPVYHPEFDWSSLGIDWKRCDLSSILTFQRKIIEKQTEVVKTRQNLIKFTQEVINEVQNVLISMPKECGCQ
ncbi:coagulation factor IX-like [Hemitrygon akajei]|uniref:coagulation factor IX-like n=1 Tax=Hemitrygon akajei TaxID=2704970 RepID=UPI003BF9596A